MVLTRGYFTHNNRRALAMNSQNIHNERRHLWSRRRSNGGGVNARNGSTSIYAIGSRPYGSERIITLYIWTGIQAGLLSGYRVPTVDFKHVEAGYRAAVAGVARPN
jgi:hypothetical protein